MAKATRSSSSHKGSVTRRDLLKVGGVVIPAAMLLPPWRSARAQTAAAPFDFYVSPTGSDSNPGTVAEPWAITSLMLIARNPYNVANCNATSGKRIGFLPGTYYLTTAFKGTIASGSNMMTVSGITGAITPGMHLVSGLGSAFSTGKYGWGPMVTAVSGSTITLNTNASAGLSGATIVATFMVQDPIGALQLIGSTNSSSPTYWGSSDSSGNESARTATLDAEGGSGVYGGYMTTSSNTESMSIIAHIGEYPSTYTVGNATLSGLVLRGYSYYGIQIGAHSMEDGPPGITGIIIQNCEITDGNTSAFYPHVDNTTAIWIDCTTGALIRNNWIHDCVGPKGTGDHLSAIQIWGAYATHDFITTGTIIEYNTCVNAGNIYGKEVCIDQTTVRYNYLDTSALTNSAGMQDFTGAPTTGLSGTTYFYNNIVVFNAANQEGGIFGGPTLSNSYGLTTAVEVYNNTIIVTKGGVATVPWLTGSGGAVRAVKYYNNIYVNSSTSGGNDLGVGNHATNPAVPAVWDYNLDYSPNVQLSWTLYENSSFTTPIGSYTTAASFAAALASNGGISNAEAHSIIGTAPTFVNTGTYAQRYQLASGSAGKGAGSTTGTSSGSACDMGAWGNGATWIGCNFAYEGPSAPVLDSIS
ncbi:MAG TPA: hypothetical protein VJ738_08435 [Steroidobacteraceae bacterium]|nr:hypothetical protein [Steroidobacteraceae bacterium]